jgi:hypothetical protein
MTLNGVLTRSQVRQIENIDHVMGHPLAQAIHTKQQACQTQDQQNDTSVLSRAKRCLLMLIPGRQP